MRTLSAALVALSALSASAPAYAGYQGGPTSEGYTYVVSTWENGSADQLVRQWGTPAETFRKANGNVVYVFSKQRVTTTPVTAYTDSLGITHVNGGDVLTWSCRTEFEVNDGTVVWWTWKGNDCVAYAPAWLGIQGSTGDRGVLVEAVTDGSPARELGLRAGAVITEIDGVRVDSMEELKEVLSAHHAGDKVLVKYTFRGAGERGRVRLAVPPRD